MANSVTLAFIGDVMLGRGVNEEIPRKSAKLSSLLTGGRIWSSHRRFTFASLLAQLWIGV
ncbi:hypothetical protein H6G75_19855 [Nostoc sp. FACHB-280]|nr:hypothetical protein [Nostoc sp. FACHB-280]